MRIATFAVVVTLIVCAIGLAAGEGAKSKTHTITIEGMRFHPQLLTVAEGDTIVWVNRDLVPHTATSEAGRFDSQMIQPEQSWRFTPGRKGEFAYVCTFHPTMKATLQVR